MAQIFQTKTKVDERGKTSHTAEYVLTAGETTISIDPSHTPGTITRVEITDIEAGLKRARVVSDDAPVPPGTGTNADNTSGNSGSSNTVEIITGTRTEPIETYAGSGNYNFSNMAPEDVKEVKDAVNDIGNASVEIPTTGAKAELYNLLIKGVTSYLAPAITMRFTYVSSGPPSLANLMKIFTPRGAPILPGGGNWLFTNCSYVIERVNGRVQYRITEDYSASGKGGWNSDIYS
jgi:hypothetical protein